jgi:hypothetical protein
VGLQINQVVPAAAQPPAQVRHRRVL